MALTPAEQKAISEGAESVRRKQEAEQERQKTKEFEEMRKRNEARPPAKPMPTAREYAKEKVKEGGKRVVSGIDSFVGATPKKKTGGKVVKKYDKRGRVISETTYPAPAPKQPRGGARRNALLGSGSYLGGFGGQTRAPRKGRAAPARQPDLLGGSFSGLGFSGDLLGGGFGGSSPRRKKKGGWGLL